MKKTRKNNGNSNKGFSLIEVLLAIVILGLVAAPILQIFVTSGHINNNSRKLMAATDVANLTMEYLTGMKFEEGDDSIKKVFTEAGDLSRIPSLGYSSNVVDLGAGNGTIDLFTANIATNHNNQAGKCIFYNTNSDTMGFAFNDVKYNNYVFDMIIWFESNKEGSDKFYTYDVTVEVYSAEDGVNGDGDPITNHFAEKMISINGAVANK